MNLNSKKYDGNSELHVLRPVFAFLNIFADIFRISVKSNFLNNLNSLCKAFKKWRLNSGICLTNFAKEWLDDAQNIWPGPRRVNTVANRREIEKSLYTF